MHISVYTKLTFSGQPAKHCKYNEISYSFQVNISSLRNISILTEYYPKEIEENTVKPADVMEINKHFNTETLAFPAETKPDRKIPVCEAEEEKVMGMVEGEEGDN